MKTRLDELLTILRIGHDTSMRGEGISLKQALSRVSYREVRRSFSAQDLIPLIQAHNELVMQWVMYSEDKRTSGGWYLTEAGDIGQVNDSSSTIHFESIEEAVAEYVVRELDFWATF